MNLTFTSYDSVNRAKISGQVPMADQMSSLYNYAVCMSSRACYMDLSGDGIKQASQLFRKAAWIFNHLITASSQLPAGFSSVDFHKESLTMNRELCLA